MYLKDKYPQTAKEFDSGLNRGIKFRTLTVGSRQKVFWKCPKGVDHIWQASPNQRTSGGKLRGCPVCTGKKVVKSVSLATTYPRISKEWNYRKNGLLTPENITSGSNKKVWWKCLTDPKHEWQASPKQRTKQNNTCSICNSLGSCYPKVAKEWHPIKNKGLTPFDIPYSSHQKVWWKCDKGNVPLQKLNKLFGYQEHYRPQGFSMVNDEAVENFIKHHGDIFGVLKTLERNEELIEIPEQKHVIEEEIEEQIENAVSEHDEMQWRLIRLGRLARFDIWVPARDQSKQYQGHRFRDFVIPEFRESLDVPPTIKNIDVVWKFGPYSIKAAFEIEHSTSIYSGILRLSDLRAETPNSNYPLFIIASEERRRKVFNELLRPTFSGPALRLNEVIRYLGYSKIREIDESFKNKNEFDANFLLSAGERLS